MTRWRDRKLAFQAAALGGGAPDPVVTYSTLDYPNVFSNVATGTTDGQRFSNGIPTSGTGSSDGGDTALATTSVLASTIRSRRLSATGVDQSAGWSSAVTGGMALFWRGTYGGFLARFRFGLSQWIAGHQAFAGLRASVSDIGNTDPIDLVDCIGVGVDPGDTSWSVFHNDGSGQCTKIPTGIAVDTATALELTIVAPQGGSSVSWILRNLETGFERRGNITTNMPGSTTFLSPHTWANTGGSAGPAATAVRIDLIDWTIATASPSVDSSGDLGLQEYENVVWSMPSCQAAGTRINGGMNATFLNGASGASQPAPTSTSLFTSLSRTRQVSTTAANSTASLRENASQQWIGNASARGGYLWRLVFSWEQWAAGMSAFVGIRALSSDISTAEPDSLVNIVGIGVRSDQTRWRWLHNDGSGTATSIDPGASFDVVNQDVLELRIVCLANASSIAVRLRNLTTGASDSRTLSTDLPVNTAFVGYHVHTNTRAVSATPSIICTMEARAQSPTPLLA